MRRRKYATIDTLKVGCGLTASVVDPNDWISVGQINRELLWRIKCTPNCLEVRSTPWPLW